MASDNVKVFEAGQGIFGEGEKGDLMYVLLEGTVDLTMKVEHGQTVLKTVDTPNDFFGEMALLDDKPRSASAVATRRAKVLVVDGPTFESMIVANGKFALRIIKVLSDRLRQSNDQVSDLIETMPRDRVARGMADFAQRHGERIHDGSIKVNLAAMTGWINMHLGIATEEIEAAVARFLKGEVVAWAPTSAKTRENLLLPESFVQENDRRAQL